MLRVISAVRDRWVQRVYLKKEINNELREGREREKQKNQRKRLMSKKQRKRERDRERDSHVQEVKKPGQTKIKLVSNANQTERAKDR